MWSKPYVEITRTGRWRHEIAISRDVLGVPVCFDTRAAYGRPRAERKARKLLDRYLRNLARESETVRIDSEVS